MELLGERVFVKTGAEGVYCAALPELGYGIALKCDDGAGRAAEVVMASADRCASCRLDDAERAFAAACRATLDELERHRDRRDPPDRSAQRLRSCTYNSVSGSGHKRNVCFGLLRRKADADIGTPLGSV